MTSPIDINITSSSEESALLPEKDFMIKSSTMTPTAQSERDFLLATQRVSPQQSTCTCIGGQDKECKKCLPTVRAPSPTSPLLSPPEPANRNMSTARYGSVSRSPSPTDNDSLLVRVTNSSINSRRNVEASVRCGCHAKVKDNTSRKARIKLVTACIIALAFMIGEVVGMTGICVHVFSSCISLLSLPPGGYFSHSLAIMTDAAHMLSDFASFLISLFSIWMATRPPSKRMSFGWHRAGETCTYAADKEIAMIMRKFGIMLPGTFLAPVFIQLATS